MSLRNGQTSPLSESGTRHSTSRLTCLTAFDSRKKPAVRNSQRRNNSEQIGRARIKNGYAVYFLQRQAPGAQVAGPCVSSAPGELTCLVPRSHRNAGLQTLLHAAVREDDPQTSDAKWARGSRSQTHRRAAKGGFTQGDVKVRRPRPDRTLLFPRCSEKLWLFESPKTNSDPDSGTGPTPPVTVLRVKPIAGAYSREHCPRVYAICRPELG